MVSIDDASAGSPDNVIIGYVTNLNTGGTLTPSMIYAGMTSRENYFYALYDTYTRNTLWLGRAPGGNNDIAEFYTVDSVNNQIIKATLDSQGTVVYSFIPIGGGGTTPTWNDIKPSGGVPKTDLASAVQQSLDKADLSTSILPITFGISGTSVDCDTPYTDIYNAIAAGKIIIPYFDYLMGSLSGDVGQNNDYVFTFIDLITTPNLIYKFTIDYQDNVTVSTREIGDAHAPTLVTDSSSAPASFIANDNYIYNFTNAALTSLTITGVPSGATQATTIIFNSGSTPTSLTLPSNVKTPSGFSVAANTHYEISISGTKYAVVASWPLT